MEMKSLENGGGVSDPLEWQIGEDRGYWDICLLMNNVIEPSSEGKGSEKKKAAFAKKRKERGRVLHYLKTAGLMLRRHISADEQGHFYLVSAKQDRLELQAEIMELEMRLQPKFGGGYAPFSRKNKHIFLKAFDDDFFTRTQRQYIVRSIIESDSYNGGASLSIHRLVKKGILNKCFPLHEKATKKYLSSVWAHWKVFEWWKKQPLHVLRDYFGEELTLYFAWLGYYNSTLVLPSLLGIVVFILQFVDGTDGWPNVIFSFFMMVWTTLFLEFWKRKQNILAFQWNMSEFEQTETSRPDYNGKNMLGVFSMGQWVPFKPNDPVLEKVHVAPTRYYPSKRTKFKMAGATVPLMTSLITVIVIVLVVLGIRLFLQKAIDGLWGGIIGSVIGAVLIIVFNVLYKKLAVKLNDWENHRTQTEYDDNLITKTILFQFVNTFTSLYYIAFIKSGFTYFGVGVPNSTRSVVENVLFDACKTVLPWEDEASGDVIGSGCISELGIQTMTLMAVNLFVGQTKEILIPLGKIQVQKFLKKFKAADAAKEELEARMTTWERQSLLVPFEGTFDEYAEMAIQYGLITVFAAAVPGAPLLALINNVIEIRTDAIKILNTNQKPWYKGAQDIGGWYNILDVISIISVTTNAMLVGLGYAAIPKLVGYGKLGLSFNTFIFCVILEHVTLIFKALLAALIPDMPGHVTREMARQTFLKNEVLKELESKPAFRFHVPEEVYENFGYEDFKEGHVVMPDTLKVTYGLQAGDLTNAPEEDDEGST